MVEEEGPPVSLEDPYHSPESDSDDERDNSEEIVISDVE